MFDYILNEAKDLISSLHSIPTQGVTQNMRLLFINEKNQQKKGYQKFKKEGKGLKMNLQQNNFYNSKSN